MQKLAKLQKKFVKNRNFTFEPLTLYKQKQYHCNWQKQKGKVRKIQVFIANQGQHDRNFLSRINNEDFLRNATERNTR